MERLTMFLDWKNQYWFKKKKKRQFQIQCNPYQNTNGLFHRRRTEAFQICTETNFQIPKTILRKKKGAGGIMFPELTQTTPQSYSNHNSLALAQQQTHRSTDRKSRNKPRHLWSINL